MRVDRRTSVLVVLFLGSTLLSGGVMPSIAPDAPVFEVSVKPTGEGQRIEFIVRVRNPSKERVTILTSAKQPPVSTSILDTSGKNVLPKNDVAGAWLTSKVVEGKRVEEVVNAPLSFKGEEVKEYRLSLQALLGPGSKGLPAGDYRINVMLGSVKQTERETRVDLFKSGFVPFTTR
jgi:hypothetical protein